MTKKVEHIDDDIASSLLITPSSQHQQVPMMDKIEGMDGLPVYTPMDQYAPHHRRRRVRRRALRVIVLACIGYIAYSQWFSKSNNGPQEMLSAERLNQDYATCAKLRSTPVDPSGYRNVSARYVEGGKPVLIRNATVWTGEPKPGTEDYSWDRLDVLLRNGLIEQVSTHISDDDLPEEYDIVEAHGRQLTAGIIDMHSHTGVDSLPELRGNDDTNELSEDITPFVRSLDGLNPLDPQIQVSSSLCFTNNRPG